MNRSIRILAAALTVALLLSLTAFAGDFTALADELNDMGMFKGTNNGYELDAVPTRGQAAVMLVRLLGQEEAATAAWEAGTLTHPYVDAQAAWVAPAVAYLHAHGLTNGMGVNARKQPVFGLQNACSAQMYCTFLLRALGYADTGAAPDFTYAQAVPFAQEKGVVEPELLADGFTRDEVVASSYQALGTPVKGQETLLLAQLVAAGAIDADAAGGSIAKMQAWNAVDTAMAQLALQTALDLTVGVQVDVGEAGTTAYLMAMQIQYAGGDEPRLACTLGITSGGEEQYGGQWYRDGWLYLLTTEGAASKRRTEEIPFGTDDLSAGTVTGNDCIYMFSDWAVSDDGRAYTFLLSPRFYAPVREALAAQGLDDGGELLDAFLVVELQEDGTLASAVLVADMQLEVVGVAVPACCQLALIVNATGDAVTVEYPDELADFPEAAE